MPLRLDLAANPLSQAYRPGNTDHDTVCDNVEFLGFLTNCLLTHYSERSSTIGAQHNAILASDSNDECHLRFWELIFKYAIFSELRIFCVDCRYQLRESQLLSPAGYCFNIGRNSR